MEKTASKGTYILAWIISCLASNLFSFLAMKVVNGIIFPNKNIFFIIIYLIFSVVVAIFLIIFQAFIVTQVYEKFKNIKISKVIPWFWGMGIWGIIKSFGDYLNSLPMDERNTSNIPFVFLLSLIAGLFFYIKIIKSYFRKEGRL